MSSYKWKKVQKRDYTKIAAIAVVCIVAGALLLGYATLDLSGVGVDVEEYIAREDVEVPVGSKPVTLKMYVDHKLDRGYPAATSVRLYDANKEFFASADTSSGVAAFTGVPIWEGETLYYQARAEAPSHADYVTYTTPLTEFVVPLGDESSVAAYGPIYLWEISTGVATFIVTDQDGKSVAGETAALGYLNTTADTGAFVRVSITADCAFGTPEDFTDYDTGKSYLAGVWLVAKFTALQDVTNAHDYYYDGAHHVYIFRIGMIVNDNDLGYTTVREFEIKVGSGGFVASANAKFDIFDICQLNSAGKIDANSFKDGDSDLQPVEIVSKVA